jgi:hypothetical protein
MSMAHGAAMVGVGVVGAIVAFWLLSSIVGIFFFIFKIVVIVGLIAGAFWLVEKIRH